MSSSGRKCISTYKAMAEEDIDEEDGGLEGLDALVGTEEAGSSDLIGESDKAVAIKTKWTPEEVNTGKPMLQSDGRLSQ